MLNAAPQRVVALSPALTETLFCAGIRPVYRGRGSVQRQPSAAKKLPACGTALEPDTAAILALRPDAVFTPVRLAAWAREALERAGVAVLKSGTPTIWKA